MKIPFGKITLIFFITLLVPSKPATATDNQTLLWKITGNGLKNPSYLYGTFHSRDARVFEFNDSVMVKFNETQALALELVLDSTIMTSLFSMMMADDDYSLKALLPAETYQILNDKFKNSVGVGLALFDKVKPLFVYMLLQQQGLGEDEELFLDQYFDHLAKKREIPIHGLETVKEQLDALDVMPIEEQITLLIKEVEDPTNDSTAMNELIDAYRKGDLKKMQQMIEKESFSPEFHHSLITVRNQRMADRIPALIEKQPTFIAVGAGHLPGKDGVIELLKAKGYTVTPVKPPTNKKAPAGNKKEKRK